MFGAVNYLTGGLFFAATIPPIIQIHRRLGAGPGTRAALAAVTLSSGAAAASGVALAVHAIPFAPSTAISVAGIVGQATWTALAHHRLLGREHYPRRLAQAGRAIGVGMLLALPLAGLRFAASRTPGIQRVFYGVAGTVGGVSYLAWPVWMAIVGRQLGRGDPRRHLLG